MTAASTSTSVRRAGPVLLRAFAFLSAWVLLGLTRFLVLVAPFRAVRRVLGEPVPLELPARPATPRQLRRGQRIGRTVQRAAGATPWRSECYPQALTARCLLAAARVPHVVVFGVRRTAAGALVAHAWVIVGSACVVGGDPRAFTAVGAFSHRRPDRSEPGRRHGNLRLLRAHAAKRDRAA